ncbi:hypothetical protein C7974DRAFT_96415 [Boeremia exigua]|uniref:uncharacterized protein n=1 Tax=Boeremia exigua TaxID=749465 RepID=UPI001E8E1A17|nr:uncharacterized protein C7974DRAFT_96415 [Boeremia exigua]KAH6642163.1 hypothetical protein C7974DRAFT_96415 [Boeremia exigua]
MRKLQLRLNIVARLRQLPGLELVGAPPAEIGAPAIPVAVPLVPANPPAAVPPAALPAVEPVSPAVPAVGPVVPPPAIAPAVVPAPAPAAVVPPAIQADPPPPLTATFVSPFPALPSMPSPPLVTGDDFVTIQWVETHIGTLRTWVPKTHTVHFEAMSQAPLPGVGSIGMGSLTGKTGQTQTIYMVVGAAPTSAIYAKAVVAAMVGGVAGLVV